MAVRTHVQTSRRCSADRDRLFMSTESNTQGGKDTRNGECEAAKTHADHRRELDPGMYVVLDHDLEAKCGMMEEGDQKQHHQDGRERCPQPGDEGGVIAAAMRDDRGDEPEGQGNEGDR